MIWDHKAYNYAISRYFDERYMRKWPGLEIARDDGYTVRRDWAGPQCFYVMVVCRELLARDPAPSGGPYREMRRVEAARRLELKPPVAALSDGDMFRQIANDLEEQIEKFWQDTHQDWPGLGPAGRQ